MEYPERIQRSIDYIESYLNEPLQYEAIARQAYLSIPHLYRIFPIMTGCTVGQYIRKRRLTSSAHDLLHTRKRVIDIAVEYQFESQESYIRAFKAMFGVTPGGYRKSKGIIALYNPVSLNKLQKKGDLPMQPDIVKRKFLLVGVEGEIDLRSDFTEALAALRGMLTASVEGIGNRTEPERMIGVWLPHPENAGKEEYTRALYFTGIAVSAVGGVPAGFVVKDFPESLFAVFREKTRGTMSRYMYVEWLPASGYILNEDLMGDFEIFDDTQRCAVDDECDILLPVRAV